ncbi:MAG: ATP synthase F1 subunit gamma [Pirellulales bacterium]|nr:ATP synthase F1 subunit gamma [Pirellulales bacterium]
MAKARALDKRRKSIKNIRKITRTMELIATARFKKAMDRAHAATAYTRRMTALVADLARSGLDITHPLLVARAETRRAALLVITSNRGLCAGYNSNVLRLANERYARLREQGIDTALEVSGKRGISAFKFRGIPTAVSYTQFEDKPTYDEIEVLAKRYLEQYVTGQLDRLDVVYTRFENVAKQAAVVETLLPLAALDTGAAAKASSGTARQYEFLPSAASILEEVVPTSFKVKLFKCFLDAAVSEQIARMVAMKSATENADKMIKSLSMTYNRARQSQITSDLLDVLGGVEALKG